MGKGDKKTKRGKIVIGSYGKRRPRKDKPALAATNTKVKAEPKAKTKAEPKAKAKVEAKEATKPKKTTKKKVDE